MNQYEIELRDKFALKAIDALIKQNEDCDHTRWLGPKELSEQAYEWAGKIMAERQKHLDVINLPGDKTWYVDHTIVRCICGWEGERGLLVNEECPICVEKLSPIPAHKAQGTECEK